MTDKERVELRLKLSPEALKVFDQIQEIVDAAKAKTKKDVELKFVLNARKEAVEALKKKDDNPRKKFFNPN